jgi:hypothetical protein
MNVRTKILSLASTLLLVLCSWEKHTIVQLAGAGAGAGTGRQNSVVVQAFTIHHQPSRPHVRRQQGISTNAPLHDVLSVSMSTVTAPPEEKTKTNRKTGGGGASQDEDNRSNDPDDIVRYNDAPMEYLEDEWATRNPDDPFHILLLDTTFTKNERVTVSYIAGCITYVLGMPNEEALELTAFAAENGFSCLGTWEREECLSLGKQLQSRDCVVRIVPYCQGGARGWQMKDASAGASSSSGSSSFGGGSVFE